MLTSSPIPETMTGAEVADELEPEPRKRFVPRDPLSHTVIGGTRSRNGFTAMTITHTDYTHKEFAAASLSECAAQLLAYAEERGL